MVNDSYQRHGFLALVSAITQCHANDQRRVLLVAVMKTPA